MAGSERNRYVDSYIFWDKNGRIFLYKRCEEQ